MVLVEDQSAPGMVRAEDQPAPSIVLAGPLQVSEEPAEVEATDGILGAPRLSVVVDGAQSLTAPSQTMAAPSLSIALRPAAPSLVAEHLPETQGLEGSAEGSAQPSEAAKISETAKILVRPKDETSVVMRADSNRHATADIRVMPHSEPTLTPAQDSPIAPQLAEQPPAAESPLDPTEELPWSEPEAAIAQNIAPAAASPAPPAEEVQSPNPIFDLDNRPIASVTANIGHSKGDLPQDLARARLSAMRDRPYNLLIDREWQPICYLWDAPALRHQPLYFEEVNLERYGYRWPLVGAAQPVCSALHFYGTLPLLPYKMWSEPYNERIYTLGHYRPGSPVPYQTHWPRWRPGAFSFEAAVATGLVFLLP